MDARTMWSVMCREVSAKGHRHCHRARSHLLGAAGLPALHPDQLRAGLVAPGRGGDQDPRPDCGGAALWSGGAARPPWLELLITLVVLVVLVVLQQRAPVGVVLHPVDSAPADARSCLAATLLHPAFRALHHALGKVALVHGDEVVVDLTLVVVRHVSLPRPRF